MTAWVVIVMVLPVARAMKGVSTEKLNWTSTRHWSTQEPEDGVLVTVMVIAGLDSAWTRLWMVENEADGLLAQ